MASTRYTLRGTGMEPDPIRHQRTSFISAADDVMVFRLTASHVGSLDFELGFDSPQDGALTVRNDNELLFLERILVSTGSLAS